MFTYKGVDLDDLFDPYVSGTKTCPAGEYIYNGQDIRDRYAPLSTGIKRQDVGYKIDGVDITNYFAAKNTAVYWDGTLDPLPFSVNGQTQSSPIGSAIAEVLFYPDGTIRQRINDASGGVETVLGEWDGVIADSSNTEVFFEVLSSDIPVSGAIGTWLQVNSIRPFNIETTDPVQYSATVRVRLRGIGLPNSEITKDVNLFVSYGGL